jgi:tRNA-Thr(GGU) m(6)t(6)A37 methyltransferase TsaA
VKYEDTILAIGVVRSPITKRDDAPRQGSEGAPDVSLEIDAAYTEALDGLNTGDEIIVITWFHKARRDELKTHPRGDPDAPLTGVFATRSPDRPNPLGLHRATIKEIGPSRIVAGPIEAIDGTPIVDVKIALSKS